MKTKAKPQIVNQTRIRESYYFFKLQLLYINVFFIFSFVSYNAALGLATMWLLCLYTLVMRDLYYMLRLVVRFIMLFII
jgi:hypothetical protein